MSHCARLRFLLLFVLTPVATLAQTPIGYIGFEANCGGPCNNYPSFYEDQGSARVSVYRTNSQGTASATFYTENYLAEPNQRWVSTSGTVTFNDGEWSALVSIPLIDNNIYDQPSISYFKIRLTSPSAGYAIGIGVRLPFLPLLLSDSRTIIVRDDEPRDNISTFTTEFPWYAFSETVGNVNIVVNRSGTLMGTDTISFQSSFRLPATPSSGTLTFSPGERSKIITLSVIDDDLYQGTRTGYIQLQAVPPSIALFGDGQSSLLIYLWTRDNENRPSLIVDDVAVTEGNTTKTASFRVRLSNKAEHGAAFQWATRDGTAIAGADYVASGGVGFLLGDQTALTGILISVPIIGDTIAEPGKTFSVDVKPVDWWTTQDIGFPAAATCTIFDDDGMQLSPQSQRVTRGTRGVAVLSIGAGPHEPLIVTLSSSDADVVSVPRSIQLVENARTIEFVANTPGRATITATSPGYGSKTCEVVVVEEAKIVFTPANVRIGVGSSRIVTVASEPPLTTPIALLLTPTDLTAVSVPSTVTIPPGSSATFQVTGQKVGGTAVGVSVPPQQGGTTSSLLVDVVDTPTAPAIAAVVPSSGPASGGTAIMISGKNLQDGCTLHFGGAPVTTVVFSDWFTNWMTATATTPPHPPGSVDVTIACGAENYALEDGFTYLAVSPTISQVTPSNGSIEGGTLVQITGSDFQNSCWALFGDVPAEKIVIQSASEIIATAPPHTAGNVVVSLRCVNAADAAAASVFKYDLSPDPSPVVRSLFPSAAFPGETVRVNGIGFSGNDSVVFNDQTALMLECRHDGHVVTVPNRPLGDTRIQVVDISGRSSTTAETFRILKPRPPLIVVVDPPAASPGAEIALNGSGFQPGYRFRIDDLELPIRSMTYNSAVVRVPATLTEGVFTVSVVNAADEVLASSPTLTVVGGRSTVSDVTPACTTTEGGENITVRGNGFQRGVVVAFGDALGSNARYVDARTIVVTAPPSRAGSARIKVTNLDGTSATLTGEFVYASPFDPHGCEQRLRPAHH